MSPGYFLTVASVFQQFNSRRLCILYSPQWADTTWWSTLKEWGFSVSVIRGGCKQHCALPSCRGHLAPGIVCWIPLLKTACSPISHSYCYTGIHLWVYFHVHSQVLPNGSILETGQPFLWPQLTGPNAASRWLISIFLEWTGGQREPEGCLSLGIVFVRSRTSQLSKVLYLLIWRKSFCKERRWSGKAKRQEWETE